MPPIARDPPDMGLSNGDDAAVDHTLRNLVQSLLDAASKVNTEKAGRYWYPLSIATYGVEEVVNAIESMCSFRTSMWTKTAEFERRFSDLQNAASSVMVNSGSSADLLIAFALVNPVSRLLRPGDEVLVPAVTWPTQIWALMMAGLKVRFVDVDPLSLNIDVKDLWRKIGDRTRAIFLVHLMGNPNDMAAISEIARARSLLVLEDCCEALSARFDGRPVGSFGVASAFSFFFSHHITTMEGGMVCTNDDDLAELFRVLRAHGWARNVHTLPDTAPQIDPRYVFLNWGFNVRPTEVAAAFGLEQLIRLPGFMVQRSTNAAYFSHHIEGFRGLIRTMAVDARAECSWFALPLIVPDGSPLDKHELVEHLESHGVETRPIAAGNIARQPVSRLFLELKDTDLPGEDAVHDRAFYIGLHPIESRANLDRLAELLDGFIRAHT